MVEQSFWDEMTGGAGDVRTVYARIDQWLRDTPPDILAARRSQAELLFRRIGITFAVYGSEDASERLIPFDIIPRVIAQKEWSLLEKGLIQRVKAINAFLTDIYGAREILRAGIVPSDLVFRNPHFRPEMAGRRAPHDIWVHIAGIDIVRTGENEFYVLEDNARTPSGVSYMLENREVMMRLLPDLFASHRIAPVENYTDLLLSCLRSLAPATAAREPVVALLTPGQFNSAYYEHSFLADRLGVELVEGTDLFVRDDVLYMRTTQGPRRIDVLYRRIDDDYLDPLVFRPDSVLGVPGILSAANAGNLTLVQRGGHRRRRRQGHVHLHARDRALLSGRGRDPQERAHMALPRRRSALLRARPSARTRRQGGQRLGRLRHARGPARDEGRARPVPRQAPRRPRRTTSPSRR